MLVHRRLRRVLRRMEGVQRLHAVRRRRRGVHRRLAARRVRGVGQHEAPHLIAGAVEVLLGADQDVARRHALRPDAAVRGPPRVVHEHRLGMVHAAHAAAGDEDRVPRVRVAHQVRERIAVAALRRVATDAATAADPRDALVVDLDVVRVIRHLVVAPQVDGVAEDLRLRRVAQVGYPDRPPVAAASRRERSEKGEVVAPGGPARPHEVAAIDARRRVTGGQLDEVTDLPQVARVGVGDDVEAAPAALRARLAHGRIAGQIVADPGAQVLADVVVARVERADDQLAARVDVHVLVLPVAVLPEDLGRLEGVEQPRLVRVAHVVGAKAEPAGRDEDAAAQDPVELALDEAGALHPPPVLEAVGDGRALGQGRGLVGGRRCGGERGGRRQREQQKASHGAELPLACRAGTRRGGPTSAATSAGPSKASGEPATPARFG